VDHIARSRLLKEFSGRTNSADIHRVLIEIKNDAETFQQYMFETIDIAKQGNAPDDAIVGYIIDGINKTLLYGATSVSEFKVKLQLYTKM